MSSVIGSTLLFDYGNILPLKKLANSDNIEDGEEKKLITE